MRAARCRWHSAPGTGTAYARIAPASGRRHPYFHPYNAGQRPPQRPTTADSSDSAQRREQVLADCSQLRSQPGQPMLYYDI